MLCGIDEAGRGCIAGDMVVAGVVLTNKIDGLMDSKKLSEKRREELYDKIIENSNYHLVSFTPQDIDSKGLSKSISQALNEIKEYFSNCDIIFDGNSSFGVDGIDTMVKADSKIAEVSAASILAKVTRDRKINQDALIYPKYSFQKHKGYGTKAHIQAIKEYGYTPIHRRSYNIKGLSK
ncbi:Ribonuclease HII [hydrothermal vent metagenome]|uniref:Ribonuclease HII n=1 Tax=hydrothermal vent metagenome TaxID=652676 RepID=A0A1W1EKX2_9ZZZZ